MLPRAVGTTLLLAALLATAGGAAAQSPRGPQMSLPQANICSTGWGWCPLARGIVVLVEHPCFCYDPRSGRPLAGITRAFNYAAYPWTVSPYLNPHWVPP